MFNQNRFSSNAFISWQVSSESAKIFGIDSLIQVSTDWLNQTDMRQPISYLGFSLNCHRSTRYEAVLFFLLESSCFDHCFPKTTSSSNEGFTPLLLRTAKYLGETDRMGKFCGLEAKIQLRLLLFFFFPLQQRNFETWDAHSRILCCICSKGTPLPKH